MRKYSKIMVGALALGMAWMLPVTTVMAGDINGNEQRVIDAAKGPYNYDGKEYVPSEDALEMLENYLEQDDVDLTPEQANEVIRMGNGSVADGVAQGYLVPVDNGEQPSEPSQPSQSTQPTEPSSSAQPTETPSQPSQSTQPAESSQASQPAESTESTEASKAEASTESVEASSESVESKESEESVEATKESVETSSEESAESSSESVSEEKPSREVQGGKFQKGLNILPIALTIAAVVVIVGVIVVLRHRNRFSK